MTRLDPAAQFSRRTGQLFFEKLAFHPEPPDLLVELSPIDALAGLRDILLKGCCRLLQQPPLHVVGTKAAGRATEAEGKGNQLRTFRNLL